MTKQNLIQPKSKIKIKNGEKFGRLEILGIDRIEKSFVYFRCRCDCGNIKNIRGYDLHNGKIKSCGCLHKERSTKHGMWNTPIYQVWCDIIQRCSNPKNAWYPYYGGRGITICRKWRNSSAAFFKDMGECPPGLTIERKNNDLGYFPNNCKWATGTEQSRNCRVRKDSGTKYEEFIFIKEPKNTK